MLSVIKSILRKTPLFPSHFARQHAPQVLEWTERDSRWADFYSRFVKPGDTVFDVGANIGHQTKVFLRLGCRVIAIEPQTICVRTLQRAFGDKITLVPMAVSNEAGIATLQNVDGACQQSSISSAWIKSVQSSGRFAALRWSMSETIKTTTFTALIERYGTPSFIKIDIQGHEAEAIESLKQPIQAISFEVTPEYSDNGLRCIDLVAAIGQYEFNFSFLDSAEMEFDNWLTSERIREFLNYVATERRSVGDVYARLTQP